MCLHGRIFVVEKWHFFVLSTYCVLVYFLYLIVCGIDVLRPEAGPAVKELLADPYNMSVVMITGDEEQVANMVAADVGITEYHSRLLPQDKLDWINNAQKQPRHKLGMWV